MQRVALIVGVESAIGSSLQQALKKAGWLVFGTTRRRGNLTENEFYLDLLAMREFDFPVIVDAVFLCASMTKITDCRNNPDYARQINQDAQIQIAEYFLQRGSHVVFLSTSAVFNGKKPAYSITDPTCPCTLYGQYKARVEESLLRMSAQVSILRLTKVLTPEYPLILNWINALQQGKVIEPYYDLMLCPLSMTQVTHGLKTIVEKGLFGIVHLSGETDVSYQLMADYLLNSMELDKNLIQAKSALLCGVTQEEAPRYTSLDMRASKGILESSDYSAIGVWRSLYGDILRNAKSLHHSMNLG